MAYLAELFDGRLAVIRLIEGGPETLLVGLARMLFALSWKDADPNLHFDPAVHTLEALGAGLPGRYPLTAVEVADADLPYHIKGNGDPLHGACLDPNCHDRYFRDAMMWDETSPAKCRCAMPKAEVIHMDRIRKVRDAELAKLDVPFMKALESGDTAVQQGIAAQKQLLRDLPQTFDLTVANTPEELKVLWPAGLL
tara:strand:- start:1655 stop:2242 length:588 start_codon:yes stop_codon:yes gene_type:complete